MIRNRLLLKSMAVFLVIETLFSTVAPTISWALTSGPTAPEATSFEPVDTTDMVDLKTGDFNYNIPIVEVPGPAGSYPLSLSYHAGIQPGMDASWVGLGFNLNPGSISRLVNGYPDDQFDVGNSNHTFWEGGEMTSRTYGISVGIANIASVSAGLEFAQDTYRGRGVGAYIGVGARNGLLRAGIQGGVSPYGDTYVGIYAGIGVSSEVGETSARIGYSTNSGFNASAAGGIGVGRFSALDASIDTRSKGASVSIGGLSQEVYNSRAGKISTVSGGYDLDIPIYIGVNIRLGRSYQRYWIDETEHVRTYGSLYPNYVAPSFLTAFDTYDLPDLGIDVATFDDSEKVLGGSFPDVDSYSISAQGLSGHIKPFHFRENLYKQDKKDENNTVLVKNYKVNSSSTVKPIEFRFLNDFSNRYEYSSPDFQNNGGKISYSFTGDPVTGKDGESGFENNHLAGSRHVDWYTNHEILNDSDPFERGFVDCSAIDFQRSDDKLIGGFSVTNESGVTYHYALPAYSYQEYMKSENVEERKREQGEYYNSLSKAGKYAYTWFLTAVTGPDFVDRNSNGLADHGDWGYWVNFEYRKHLANYKWRNPGEGAHKDIDGEFENFSAGLKEIYYLDKIITESHVAIFEKSSRYDGREVSDLYVGGFDAKTTTSKTQQELDCIDHCESLHCPFGDCDEEGYSTCVSSCDALYEDITTTEYPRSTLKLDKVLLYNYVDFDANRLGMDYVIRSCEFEYDYSLATGTPNSFQEGAQDLMGKLTLRSVTFSGKGGVTSIPPMKFDYKNAPYEGAKTDVWGFYKSDYSEAYENETNRSIARMTTPQSAMNVDAWSLTHVTNPLGATISIKYESDQYEDIALANSQFLRVKDVVDVSNGKFKISFWEHPGDLHSLFSIGANVDLHLIGAFQNNFYSSRTCNCPHDDWMMLEYNTRTFSGHVTIDAVNPSLNEITVSNGEYYNEIKNLPKTFEKSFVTDNDCGDILTCVTTFAGGNAMPDYFPAGLISIPETSRYGGGLRVKSVELDNILSGESRKTSYSYSGGMTSYEPFEVLAPKIHPAYLQVAVPKKTRILYKKEVLKLFSEQLSISREIPGPGVIYKNVIVNESVVDKAGFEQLLPGMVRYEFETFNDGLIKAVRYPTTIVVSNDVYEGVSYKNSYLNKVVLKDFSSRTGALRKIVTYGPDNQPLIETENVFLHDDLTMALGTSRTVEGVDGSFTENETIYQQALAAKFNNQGVTDETFTRSRIVLYKKTDLRPYLENNDPSVYLSDERHMLATISVRETYPSVQIGKTTVNHKTGVKTFEKTIEFDYYSGNPTKTLTSDGYGNYFLTEVQPAYCIAEYAGDSQTVGMGLKTYNPLNKNMLTQTASEYVFKVGHPDTMDKVGLVTASAQTWSDQVFALEAGGQWMSRRIQPGIWRKWANYGYTGNDAVSLGHDGLYPADMVEAFDSWSASSGPSLNWQKTSDVTLYDVYSHALETRDVNEKYLATRFSTDQSKVIATASNSSYLEFAYSGAEENSTEGTLGQVSYANTFTATAHTGERALVVQPSGKGFEYTGGLDKRGRVVSVWSSDPEAKIKATINGSPLTEPTDASKLIGRAGNWYLLEARVGWRGDSGAELHVWCEADDNITYFDDFRLHPVDASMVSHVYSKWGELTHILDNNNLYTKYEYDGAGRLKTTYRESFQSNYGVQGIVRTGTVNYNYGMNNPFTVNIAASHTGSTGSVLPAGSVSIKQGGTQTFELRENCISPKLQQVLVDGKKLNLSQASTTLADGTVVQVQGKHITFKNIQSPHSLSAQFGVSTVLGTVECVRYDYGNGNICYEGEYRYAYFNDCGEPINWVTVMSKQAIPADLRSLAVDNCCIYNSPNTTCNCIH